MAVKKIENQALKSIGAIVRNVRKAKHLSQSELAEKATLNQKTISALENGANGVEARTLLRVLEELGLSLEVKGADTIYIPMEYPARKLSPERTTIVAALRKAAPRLKSAGLKKLFLFGSVARDQAKPESDIDLAFELSIPPDINAIGKIEDMIQELFPFKVDFVRLKSLKSVVRESAEKDMIDVI
jgi:predicted nucleotidyltransferase/DNA-binding XRE family transcriptional regulator